MNTSNLPTVTFGIPTRNGSKTLLRTVESIYTSASNIPISFIVIADTKPIKSEILHKLQRLGVTVIQNKTPGSQYKKVNQLIPMVKTEYLVLTQDDVIFDKKAVTKLIDSLRAHPETTLLLPKIASSRATSIMERILDIGIKISYQIGINWNDANNYLLANGRCMVFKTQILRQFTIPDTVVNGDALLYFLHKYSGGIVRHEPGIIIYNNNPKYMSEHINQAKRFQFSQTEMQQYFNKDMVNEYAIPKMIILKSIVKVFILSPIYTILYIGVNLYTSFKYVNTAIIASTSWDVARSTKRVHN